MKKRNLLPLLLAAAVLMAAALAGCQGSSYDRIDISGADDGEEIRIDEETAASGNGASGEGVGTEGGGAPGEADGGSDAQPVSAEDVTILFVGDIYLSEHVLAAYDAAGDASGILDESYREALLSADFFAANEEFPFSDRGTKAQDKEYTYRLAPERAEIFTEIGLDGVTLANNHSLDYGMTALEDTMEILDEAGILHTGAGDDITTAGEPVLFEMGGQSFALLGATRVIPQADWAAWKGHGGLYSTYDVYLEEVTGNIESLAEAGRTVIVYAHWGTERDTVPKDYQRTLAQAYIDAGASLVLGSHPHVLQGIEYYKGVPIFYSLGNFLFGSSIPRTMALKTVWSGDTLSLQLIPGTSGAGYTRTLSGEECPEFYSYLQGISFGVSISEDGTVTQAE